MNLNITRLSLPLPPAHLLLSCICVALFCVTTGFTEVPHPPTGTGPLPDLRKGGSAGVAISQAYASRYSSVLPPEVTQLLSEGSVAFEAALAGSAAIELPASAKNVAVSQELTGQGSLSVEYSPRSGLPFSFPSAEILVRDPAVGAAAALWNGAAQLWRLGHLEVDAKVRIYQDPRGAPRDLSFLVARIYPRNFGPVPGKLASLFRERIELTSPTPLVGTKWLTLRFLGVEEDYVWASSPTTQNVRQMTGSNRADPMFPRGFSPDDLFVWSGKIESASVRSVKFIPVLVPVIATPFTAQPEVDGCTSFRAEKGAMFELRSEARRVPQAPGWLPSNAVWILRYVWRIEIENRDPFSLDTRSVVYIDSDTYAPVYRMVFDKTGKLLKTVIGILGAVEATKGLIPFWRGEAIVSAEDRGVTTIEATHVRVCATLAKGRELRDFDPAHLIEVKKKSEAVAPTAAPVGHAVTSPHEPDPED